MVPSFGSDISMETTLFCWALKYFLLFFFIVNLASLTVRSVFTGTSRVRDPHRVLVLARVVAVAVVVARVEMIEMWIWRTATVAARSMMAVMTRRCLDRDVFYVTQVLGIEEKNKDNLAETVLETFPYTPSYYSLDVIFTSSPSFICLHETNHYSSFFWHCTSCSSRSQFIPAPDAVQLLFPSTTAPVR